METPQEAVQEVQTQEPEVKAKRVRKSKPKASTPFKVGESGFLTKSQRTQVTVVTDEADPLFNPKVRDPEDMTGTLTQFGWLATNPLSILPDGRVMSGRTKWLSLERAEKKLGHNLEIPYVVVEMDEDAGADAARSRAAVVKASSRGPEVRGIGSIPAAQEKDEILSRQIDAFTAGTILS